jgi:hypothetical protein
MGLEVSLAHSSRTQPKGRWKQMGEASQQALPLTKSDIQHSLTQALDSIFGRLGVQGFEVESFSYNAPQFTTGLSESV